jgi:hypothetical protein
VREYIGVGLANVVEVYPSHQLGELPGLGPKMGLFRVYGFADEVESHSELSRT